MAFISWEFLAFVVIVAAAHFALPTRWRWGWLLFASVAFYGFAEPHFLPQVLAATIATYFFARAIEASKETSARQRLLTVAVVLLVANLVVSKYLGLFLEVVRAILAPPDTIPVPPTAAWTLPVGVSFYTLLLISYLADVYRGLPAERRIGLFALHVMFFPKLVSGPIERAKNLLPQLHSLPGFDRARVVRALQLVLWGAILKIFVADRISPFVNRIYDRPDFATGPQIALASWLYAFQIYADFAGYTFMAIGIALVLGVQLSQNFDRPYFATSVQDFWKRWHMSLTSWLTDYVFTPLTRQRVLKVKFFNLMLYSMLVTFLVSGFWHGATSKFVVWGALHGIYIVVSLLTQKRRAAVARATGLADHPRLHRAFKVAVTFLLVDFAYIVFRANDLGDAIGLVARLPTGWGDAYASARYVVGDDVVEFGLALAGIAVLMGAELFKPRIDYGSAIAARPAWARFAFYYCGVLAVVLLGAFYGEQRFIYFRF